MTEETGGFSMTAMMFRKHYRTIWISDVHLGTRGCQAEYLLDFLNQVECDKLYLVGDIIDGWRLKKVWYWPDSHQDVVQKIIDIAASKDTEVVYVPGNHDEFARDFVNNTFAHVIVRREDIHETADGKKLLVLHGDEFDVVVTYAKWLAFVGDTAYSLALVLNRWFNWFRRKFGYGYWSLSAYLKQKVKNAVAFVGEYEEALAGEASRRNVDGVVCGHIHHAEKRQIGEVLYLNDGDWVESCTALTEDHDGKLEILHWPSLRPMSLIQDAKDAREAAASEGSRTGAMARLLSVIGLSGSPAGGR